MFSLVAIIEDKSEERLKMSFTSIAATVRVVCVCVCVHVWIYKCGYTYV